ncbi:MAG: CapA family protein [Lachnospiraceae bacterium]
MNKRKRIVLLIAVTFSINLFGCDNKKEVQTKSAKLMESLSYAQQAEPVLQTQQAEQSQANLAEKAPEKLQGIVDLSEYIEEILDNAKKEFIGGYLIDETFLMWVSQEYGESAIRQLSETVKQEIQDKERWYQITGKSIHVLWTDYCLSTGFQSDMLKNIYWKECEDKSRVVLDFTGDINLSEGWSTTNYLDNQRSGITACVSQSLRDEMRRADILMINNEFTYSTKGTALEGKAYTFRANPNRVSVIQELGTDIVSVANNHVYDYGEDALIDTLDTLEHGNIPYVGAGRNLDEAMKPVYFIANGRKIALVSATQIERSTNYTKEATSTSPGVLKSLNPDKFVSVIEETKNNCDMLIAFVHWGTEGTNHYGKDQNSLGKSFIDAGADAIIGGHPHCLQGFEYYKNKPIIYSLGNFWFNDDKLDTGVSQVVIHTQNNTMDFRFLPCIQENCQTSLVEEDMEKQRILKFMEEISAPGIKVDADGNITDADEIDR